MRLWITPNYYISSDVPCSSFCLRLYQLNPEYLRYSFGCIIRAVASSSLYGLPRLIFSGSFATIPLSSSSIIIVHCNYSLKPIRLATIADIDFDLFLFDLTPWCRLSFSFSCIHTPHNTTSLLAQGALYTFDGVEQTCPSAEGSTFFWGRFCSFLCLYVSIIKIILIIDN